MQTAVGLWLVKLAKGFWEILRQGTGSHLHLKSVVA